MLDVTTQKQLEKQKREYIRGHLLIKLKHSKHSAMREFYKKTKAEAEEKWNSILDANYERAKDLKNQQYRERRRRAKET